MPYVVVRPGYPNAVEMLTSGLRFWVNCQVPHHLAYTDHWIVEQCTMRGLRSIELWGIPMQLIDDVTLYTAAENAQEAADVANLR